VTDRTNVLIVVLEEDTRVDDAKRVAELFGAV